MSFLNHFLKHHRNCKR